MYSGLGRQELIRKVWYGKMTQALGCYPVDKSMLDQLAFHSVWKSQSKLLLPKLITLDCGIVCTTMIML